MASVDDIFKSAGVPSKRKLEAIKDPNEIYNKSRRLGTNGSSRRAHVDNDPQDDGDAGPAAGPDGDVGPDLPPQDGDDEGDDDEGRFFGGGITKQESQILDYVEGAGDADKALDRIDLSWLRKTAQAFEKRITKNAELRAKHESEPQKFIGSEADLDADIKGLSILSEHPELYQEFVKLGCAASLVGLLAHDNTDIAIDAMEILGELTDEDVAAEDEHWDALADALLDADLVGLLVSNFSRLNEDDEADRNGVYYALGVIENLCSRASTATRIGQEDSLLRWLLQRIRRRESPVSQNKQYAAEMLAILSQSSPETRRQIASQDAVDVMLQLVAPYRKRDPDKGAEEEEYMVNLFEALTCLVDEPSGKAKFIEAEGVELCLIMLKEGKMSKAPALRLVDHAAGGGAGADVCVKLVEAGGLKGIFTLFNKTQDHRLLGHMLGIFASMLRLLPAGSAARIRTLAKFVEKDYAKVTKLVKLHREHSTRVQRAEEDARAAPAEDPEEAAVELLSRRLDAGLFTLQQIDVSLAWLVAEDGGAAKKIKQLLAERDEDLAAIAATIKEQRDGLDTAEEDSRDTSDMLGTLLDFLR
ncbi:Beta-catenin-like protein 1 [Tolypocladium ophioglossoides CBS 100239]|uniref:Beta-catenin-like protein 1 n=1 Tax=Tolypocladium ophioglossoides (strain CBS 100239) TaxID=1163406 RepID=A0A0L0N1C3_TOLOC|nr:Beta-catenin-like protein 1 [Tolypocladium ophioglossoides CBS 100239]